MNLESAIMTITGEYVVPAGQTPDPTAVTWEVRGALTVDELHAWVGEVDPHVIEAYRTVLLSTETEVIRALHDVDNDLEHGHREVP